MHKLLIFLPTVVAHDPEEIDESEMRKCFAFCICSCVQFIGNKLTSLDVT